MTVNLALSFFALRLCYLCVCMCEENILCLVKVYQSYPWSNNSVLDCAAWLPFRDTCSNLFKVSGSVRQYQPWGPLMKSDKLDSISGGWQETDFRIHAEAFIRVHSSPLFQILLVSDEK